MNYRSRKNSFMGSCLTIHSTCWPGPGRSLGRDPHLGPLSVYKNPINKFVVAMISLMCEVRLGSRAQGHPA